VGVEGLAGDVGTFAEQCVGECHGAGAARLCHDGHPWRSTAAMAA
jgi:hypothetical protein